ncbi:diguanylate cyclase/phosphodiesterase (GGDEF & EAL domains) with PAS/PAC sensor(s) [Dissulfuribacter thermophilus]|uniref:diguanylate cyclase n=2 Tax=Dissulfuribacter thermophilus TaxID=1156395 RepID=A0A1B9F7I5_9BACT|nr:diguanylate cyclase/phosphodiesterase (GGDEF & EAL domains) with PAS/PAC sensor(s) [Dissulfuribacter thermophilus]
MRPKTKDMECPIGRFDCRHLERLESVEAELKRLKEELRLDALTGLHTYAFFVDSLTKEMERTRRTGLPTSLIMLDLDHFKSINDTFGHEAGNVVLKGVGQILSNNVRNLDIPCRYGGEEFAIILPGTWLGQGVMLANRLRKILKETTFSFKGKPIPISGSFGVDTYHPHEVIDAAEFIHRTDLHLLKAKEKGRDRVCFPTDDVFTDAEVSPKERMALFNKD